LKTAPPSAKVQEVEDLLMLVIRHAAVSDTGLLHPRNEDRWYARPDIGLYFVTDGMANEITPHFVVEELPLAIREEMAACANLADPRAASLLQELLLRFNDRVREQRLDLMARGNTGATLVLALVRGAQALLAHLGDSRIYLHRGGRLEQLTRDHSILQHMVDNGQLTPVEALAVRSNLGPTRFIGMSGKAQADVRLLPLAAGDRLLLCSDGLTEMLQDDDLRAILNKSTAPEAACRRLVDAANAAGGHDNITALIVAAD
jgi:protein phosphatase